MTASGGESEIEGWESGDALDFRDKEESNNNKLLNNYYTYNGRRAREHRQLL